MVCLMAIYRGRWLSGSDNNGCVDGFDNVLRDRYNHDIFLLQGKGRDEGQDGGEHTNADGFHFCSRLLIMSVFWDRDVYPINGYRLK